MTADHVDNRNMQFLRVSETRIISCSSLNRSGMTIRRLTDPLDRHGPTGAHGHEDATLMSVQLRDFKGKLWRNGREILTAPFQRGEFSIYDYRETWRADLMTPFDCLNIHIPREAFLTLSPHLVGIVERIGVDAGESVADMVVTNIANVLASAVQQPNHASRLFTDHLELALLTHLGTAYGGLTERGGAVSRGGLTPRNLSRAQEIIEASLEGTISLEELSAACDLSPGHFSRAFKQSTGMPPHQWLLTRRVARAKALLVATEMPLSEIAGLCGFADQAHFSRMFRRLVGASPRVWRALTAPSLDTNVFVSFKSSVETTIPGALTAR